MAVRLAPQSQLHGCQAHAGRTPAARMRALFACMLSCLVCFGMGRPANACLPAQAINVGETPVVLLGAQASPACNACGCDARCLLVRWCGWLHVTCTLAAPLQNGHRLRCGRTVVAVSCCAEHSHFAKLPRRLLTCGMHFSVCVLLPAEGTSTAIGRWVVCPCHWREHDGQRLCQRPRVAAQLLWAH